jgi:hypothetical protein
MKMIKLLESILLALMTLILILIVILIISGIIYLIHTEQFDLSLGIISLLILFVCLTYGFYKS